MDCDKVSSMNNIEIDGTDWVWKTTQCDLLELFFTKNNKEAQIIKEMSNFDELSESIRWTILKWWLDKKTEMFLFAALKNHCYHTQVKEAINNNRCAILDRGIASFLTYNLRSFKDLWFLKNIISAIYWSTKPSSSIIITLPYKEIIKRLNEKNSLSRFDNNINTIMHQQALMITLANQTKEWTIIDWVGPKEKVAERIREVLF